MVETLTVFINCLTRMIEAGHSFEERSVRYFGPDRPGIQTCDSELYSKLRAEYLDHIRLTFSRLGGYLSRLEGLRKDVIRAVSDILLLQGRSSGRTNVDDAGRYIAQF